MSGSDDVASARGDPSLPTYRVSHQEIGRQAFWMLDRLLKGEKLSKMEIQIRGALVIRKST
jgi:DNA-binding LacI/PurR family transcriptional regulator